MHNFNGLSGGGGIFRRLAIVGGSRSLEVTWGYDLSRAPFLTAPSASQHHEVSSYVPLCTLCGDALPYHRPTAMGPSDHGLKPLKP
jgi:hypothetical protein